MVGDTLTRPGEGIRVAMVAVMKEHHDPATMGRLGLGAMSKLEMLAYAQSLEDNALYLALSTVMLRGFVGRPDDGARRRVAEACGLTDAELMAKANDGSLDALLVEKGITSLGTFISPDDNQERRDGITKAEEFAHVTMPWEKMDDGVSESLGLDDIQDVANSREAAGLVRRWAKGLGTRIALLTGAPGCGKTHMLMAAANMLKAQGKAVLYRVEGDIFGQLSAGMTDHDPESVYEAFATVPYLVWDDLGRQADTAYKQGVLDRLVDDRYRHEVWTLVATNLTLDKLPARAASRLRDVKLVESVTITAGDFRGRER